MPIYNSFKEYMADGTIDLDTSTFRVALATASYTPSLAHDQFNDITNELPTAGGYTANGATLDSVTWNPTGATMVFDAANTAWSSATFTARYAVVYCNNSSPATNALVCYVDFSTDQSVSNGTFTIQWDAGGIFTLN